MKKFMHILILLFLVVPMGTKVYAKETKKTDDFNLTPKLRSAILIERDTGTILYSKNENKKLPPASMTKIMSIILFMEALEQDRVQLDTTVTTSEYASSMGGSQIFLEAGEKMTFEEMLYGVTVASANDACVALAEKIYGSEQAFVVKMNEKAKELKLKHTHFSNSTGLPTKNHFSSANDMATMAKELLKYENVTKFTGTYEKYLRENSEKKFWLVNTNRLIKSYEGMDGLKTGFTNESKYCLTATAKREDMRLIAVVFGAENSKERNAQISQLLDYGFTHYKTVQQFDAGDKLTFVTVEKGVKKYVQAITADRVTLLLKRNEDLKGLKPKIEINKIVKAPIKKGDILGKISIKNGNETLAEVDVIAQKAIDSASWFDLFGRSLLSFVHAKSKVNY